MFFPALLDSSFWLTPIDHDFSIYLRMLLLVNAVCRSSSLILPVLSTAAQKIKSCLTNVIAFCDEMTVSGDEGESKR